MNLKLALICTIFFALCNGFIVKRQSEDPIQGLGGLLQGAADVIDTVIKIKKETIEPAVDGAMRAGQAIVESPVVQTLKEATEEVVDNAPKLAKRFGSVHKKAEGAAKKAGNAADSIGNVAQDLFRAGVCAFICPLQSGDEKVKCQQENCQSDNKVNDESNDYGDFNDYGTVDARSN